MPHCHIRPDDGWLPVPYVDHRIVLNIAAGSDPNAMSWLVSSEDGSEPYGSLGSYLNVPDEDRGGGQICVWGYLRCIPVEWKDQRQSQRSSGRVDEMSFLTRALST